MITDKQLNVLVRAGYDRSYASSLTKRQASKIIGEIFAEKNSYRPTPSYKITPYDHEKVVAAVKSVLNEMERSR